MGVYIYELRSNQKKMFFAPITLRNEYDVTVTQIQCAQIKNTIFSDDRFTVIADIDNNEIVFYPKMYLQTRSVP